MNIELRLPDKHSDKQGVIMNGLALQGVTEVWVANGTKYGKACHTETPIPTPNGWRNFGEIHAGDFVFDEHGRPVLVEASTDVMLDHVCYEVEFSDGHKVIADAEHLWRTTTHTERKNIARKGHTTKAAPKARTTEQIKKTLIYSNAGKPRPNHSVPCCGPVEFEPKVLPIDPYVLGVWLGDGSSWSGTITSNDTEIADEIRKSGYFVKKNKSKYAYCIHGLEGQIKSNGLFRNKHIPIEYLTASIPQRTALIQGLMDTDGTICKRGHCCFDNTNKNLVDGIEELLWTFGIKVNRSTKQPTFKGVAHKLCYRASFSTDMNVFRLPRKTERIRATASKAKTRYIVAVNAVPSVPVKCIRVANDSHLFLIGKGCIPTHNSIAASTAMCSTAPLRKQALFRWVAPIYMQAKIGYNYCSRMLPAEPHVKRNDGEPSIYFRDTDTRIQFFHGQKPESLEGEATAGNILDEAAKMREEVYAAVKTTTTVTRGKIMLVSTPLGKNWFYKGCMAAKEEMTRAKFEKRMPTKLFITAPSTDNPMVSADAIAEARRSLPDRLFRQFFLAQFVDDGQVFSGFRANQYGLYLSFDNVERQHWVHSDAAQMNVVLGVDWAKTHDWTVFVAIDLVTRRVVGFERFHNKPYTEAIRQLVRFSKAFAAVEVVLHDKTGVGMAIDDQLAYTALPYRGVVFTNTSKAEMVSRLMTSFEQKALPIPKWDIMEAELDAFEVQTSAMGRMMYSAPPGEHDDVVCALMLAHTAYLENMGDADITFLDDLGNDTVPDGLEAYYNDMSDD